MGQSKRQRRKSRAAKTIRAHAMPARLGLTCSVSIAAASAEATGPRRFKIVAYTGEPMRLHGYEDPVIVDCASIDMSGQRIPALLDHMAYESSVVGQIERVSVEGANGTPPLIAEGIFCPTDDPRDASAIVLKKADAGFQWQASIGGDPGKVEKIAAGQSVKVNGRTYAGPVCVARNVSLREISFVVLGADRLTSAVLAHNQRGKPMTFEAWLKAKGYDLATISASLKKALRAAFTVEVQASEEEETPPETEAAAEDEEEETEEEAPPTSAAARRQSLGRNRDSTERQRLAAAAEEDRQAMIRSRAQAANVTEIEVGDAPNIRRVNLVAHAIRERWDSRDVELAIIRAERTAGPNVVMRGHDKDCTLQALQGAMLLRAKGRLDNPAYQSPKALSLNIPAWLRAGLNTESRQKAMESAHKFDDMSLVDICKEALRINGQMAPHNRGQMIQAAFSGGALSNIFTTNVNAILLASFLESPDTTAGWTSETDVNDFKTQERPRVELGSGLAKLPRGGEADHANYEDNLESYKIARYAKQFQIDEQDIIDDSMGALSDIPSRFGMAAARLRPDLVYAIVLANAALIQDNVALFHSSHSNLNTSATLTSATLRAAVTAMMLIRENGINIDVTPTDILVPPSLRHLSGELINSTEIILRGSTDGERGSMNSLREDNLSRITEKRLENGVTDPSSGTAYSGSASTWYMIDRKQNTIEVAYLRGTGRGPRVRSGQLDKGSYGMWWDVSMDIGAKALAFQGLQKNTA